MTFTVTNLNGLGSGSLREAIRLFNNTSAADMIKISIFGTIELVSQLPKVTQDLTIDGEGQVTLDAGNGVDGIFATGDGYRIFDIDDRSSFTVTPGILNFAMLTMDNCHQWKYDHGPKRWWLTYRNPPGQPDKHELMNAAMDLDLMQVERIGNDMYFIYRRASFQLRLQRVRLAAN